MSLGIPGQLTHPLVVAAKEKVLQAVLKKGLAAGIHFVQPNTAVSDCETAVKAGYTFISMGTDILFLGDSARAMHSDIHKLIG